MKTITASQEFARSHPRALKVILAVLFISAVCYRFHVPLPDGAVHQRLKLTAVDCAMRLYYKYPARLIHFVSSRLSLLYTRHSLSVLMRTVDAAARIIIPSMGANLNVTDVLLDGVRARLYLPPVSERKRNGSVIFIHGGGFAIGDVLDYDYVVSYRLSPEHPFPAGLNDCERAVTHWLTSNSSTGAHSFLVDTFRTVLVGDSAGGNLVAVTTQRLMKRPDVGEMIKGQVLVYPLLQFADFRLPSYQFYYQEYKRTAFLDPYSVARLFILYAGFMPTDEMVELVLHNKHTGAAMADAHWAALRHEHLPYDVHGDLEGYYEGEHRPQTDMQMHAMLQSHVTHPEMSPLMATSEHISPQTPPTGIVTAQYDILRDEGHLYARLLRSHSIPVHELHYLGGFHGMWNFHSELEVGHESMDDVAQLVWHFVQ